MSPLKRYWWPVIVQSAAISTSLILSCVIGSELHWRYAAVLWPAIPVLLFARLIGLYLFQCLHGDWEYTGPADLDRLLLAALVGSLVFWVIERGILLITALPDYVYEIELVLTTGCLVAMRVAAVMFCNGGNSPDCGNGESAPTLVTVPNLRDISKPGTARIDPRISLCSLPSAERDHQLRNRFVPEDVQRAQ